MKKLVFRISSILALTLAGILIGFTIQSEFTGKELLYATMGIISLFISAFVLFNSSKNIVIQK